MRYDDGRLMKHPRAANFAWRCENGKFVYWFHNHGGRFIREHPRRRTIAYEERNPVWLVGGVEADSPRGKVIRWSQPEIALYDDDPFIRMSYPDLVEEGGKYYLQKDIARVHEIDPTLVEGMWSQFSAKEISKKRLVLELTGASIPAIVKMPELPVLLRRSKRSDYGKEDLDNGFSLDVWARLDSVVAGQLLVDNRTADGKGFALRTAEDANVELVLNDGPGVKSLRIYGRYLRTSEAVAAFRAGV